MLSKLSVEILWEARMLDKKKIPFAYAEVLAFIDNLGDYYRNQIPKDVLDHMERNKDPNAHFEPRASDLSANISVEASALIAALNLEYWCHDEQEKKRFLELYERNEQREKLKQYQKLREKEE